MRLMGKQASECYFSVALQVESRYPVAEVAVAVCNAHQDATAVLLGKLHEVRFYSCNPR